MCRIMFVVFFAMVAQACQRPVLRILTPPGDCKWGRLPLTVEVDASAGHYREATWDAMQAWNRALKRKAFVFAYGEPGDVLVADGLQYGHVSDRFAGVTVHSCEGKKLSAVVLITQPLDIVRAPLVTAHELGHALGLGHSENPESIMYRQVTPQLLGDWATEPRSVILSTDARVANALHPVP